MSSRCLNTLQAVTPRHVRLWAGPSVVVTAGDAIAAVLRARANTVPAPLQDYTAQA